METDHQNKIVYYFTKEIWGLTSFLKKENINKNTIIIDVWFSVVDGKIYWDADFENIYNNWNSITPVPGWVWVLTVASLLKNTLKAFKNNK